MEPDHGLRAQIRWALTAGRVAVRPAAEPDAAFAENAASLRDLTSNEFRLEGTERLAVLGRDGRWLDDCTLRTWPPSPRAGRTGQVSQVRRTGRQSATTDDRGSVDQDSPASPET